MAAGSGTKVEEINRLLKMHLQMGAMMKQMGQGKGLLGKLMGGKGAPDAAELEKMQAELASDRSGRAAGRLERHDEGRLAAANAVRPSGPWRQASGPRRHCRAWAALPSEDFPAFRGRRNDLEHKE